jgi:pilus assembly protein CpaC
MKSLFLNRATMGTAIAAVLAASVAATLPAPALAQPAAVRPANDVNLSVGTGRMVRLDSPISDIFVANDAVADVQVRSANQIYIFAKSGGETTVFATDRAGRTVYSANVRVGTNIGSVSELLRAAMPEAQITARPINGTVLLTGTVAAPDDVAEATRIVQAYVGESTQVISRLKTATPLQVMLQVKIAEVSRSLAKSIGMNLLTRDTTGGFLFGLGRGRNIGTITGTPPNTSYTAVNPPGTTTTINAAGHLLGLDILSALDLAENDGRVRTLAEPNLTALSGETASFLAGGEFPIITSSLSGSSIDYKQYGVSLAFTPTVIEGGRISIRVRPEVSELSTQGAVTINNITIPALTTRRAETTVELGSGQSFMIGGLMQANSSNAVDKAPFLGSLPILGALFRSTNFRRNETELMIVVTPYLVRPITATQVALPTDGYRDSGSAENFLVGKVERGVDGERRPGPTVVPGQSAAPALSAAGPQLPAPGTPPQREAQQKAVRPQQQASAAPGFSF